MSFVLELQGMENQPSEDPQVLISTYSYLLCGSTFSTFLCFVPESH
jgi:hypothetical protein